MLYGLAFVLVFAGCLFGAFGFTTPALWLIVAGVGLAGVEAIRSYRPR